MRIEHAATVIARSWKMFLWLKYLGKRFAFMRMQLDIIKHENAMAALIQSSFKRWHQTYYAPLRIAARNSLRTKRGYTATEKMRIRKDVSARAMVRFFRWIVRWKRNMRKIDDAWEAYYKDTRARRIQKFFRSVVAWQRFGDAASNKKEKRRQEDERERKRKATNTIGYYRRRKREIKTLNDRFVIRRGILDDLERMRQEQLAAEAKRDAALEEKRKTEENLETTIAASWKQGSDAQGRNYYYNFVTGESRWIPPENWRMKASDQWIRNVDERQNVYYYNQQTGQSRWLPPCVVCGLEAERWCHNCGTAYCEVRKSAVDIFIYILYLCIYVFRCLQNAYKHETSTVVIFLY